MTSTVERLIKAGLAKPPAFLESSVHYETIMGSVAYGVSSDLSDMDVYGFCIPPKADVFPHLRGEIPGFGKQIQRFEQYQQHHMIMNGRSYDVNIFSIVKYFQLCMDNNPNMVDSLYTPSNCVLTLTTVGRNVRHNRDLFLHKGVYHKMRGYAYSQLAKIENKERTSGVRREIIDTYGYDTKFAYHVVRLLLEAEQALETCTIDLQRDKELLKAVRSGEWSLDRIKQFFAEKEKYLETLYSTSKLPHKPDEKKIKTLLLECLEHHYGSLKGIVTVNDEYIKALHEINRITNSLLELG